MLPARPLDKLLTVSTTLVTITGPIASGKNTIASALADRCAEDGLSVVIADVDDVAAMVSGSGAAAGGLWFAAHEAHGALVAQWVQSEVDLVISVGPIYSQAEQYALYGRLTDTQPLRVVVDAPLAVTWSRVRDDHTRRLSRDREFHFAAHARFRSLLPGIPSDITVDSAEMSADEIADLLYAAVGDRLSTNKE